MEDVKVEDIPGRAQDMSNHRGMKALAIFGEQRLNWRG